MRYIKYLPLCVAALMLCSCEQGASSLDEKEERNPLVKTGQSYVEIKDWKKAEQAFKQALENDPRMARPHLELAMIYQQYKVNYIHAIYHYDRYMELRPNSNKTEFINEQKFKVAQALSNALINNSPEVKQVVDQLKKLQQENVALKQKIAGGTTPQPAAAPQPARVQEKPVEETAPKSTPAAAPQPAEHQIYHVVSGDTLSKISSKFYGDSGKWDTIYQANQDRMKSPRDLRIGQMIVIPQLDN